MGARSLSEPYTVNYTYKNTDTSRQPPHSMYLAQTNVYTNCVKQNGHPTNIVSADAGHWAAGKMADFTGYQP